MPTLEWTPIEWKNDTRHEYDYPKGRTLIVLGGEENLEKHLSRESEPDDVICFMDGTVIRPCVKSDTERVLPFTAETKGYMRFLAKKTGCDFLGIGETPSDAYNQIKYVLSRLENLA